MCVCVCTVCLQPKALKDRKWASLSERSSVYIQTSLLTIGMMSLPVFFSLTYAQLEVHISSTFVFLLFVRFIQHFLLFFFPPTFHELILC